MYRYFLETRKQETGSAMASRSELKRKEEGRSSRAHLLELSQSSFNISVGSSDVLFNYGDEGGCWNSSRVVGCSLDDGGGGGHGE